MSHARKTLYSIGTLTFLFAVGEGFARLILPVAEQQFYRQHAEIINVLGLPALNDVLEPHPYLFWALKPGLKGKLIEGHIRNSPVRFTLSTNSLGVRGGEIPPDGTDFRVLALGDSTTFGLGVGDDQAWPAILRQLLRERTGRPVEVVNAGVPGYTSFQGLRWLTDRGLALRPDLVVATFGFNDADSWESRSDMETARLLATRQWERPLLHSRIYTGLKTLWGRVNQVSTPPRRQPRLSREEFTATLGRIRQECSARDIPLLLIIWPYAGQKDFADDHLVLLQPAIAAFGASSGVQVLSLVSLFTNFGESLFLDHIHANQTGCRLAAEAVAAACLPWVAGKKGS